MLILLVIADQLDFKVFHLSAKKKKEERKNINGIWVVVKKQNTETTFCRL